MNRFFHTFSDASFAVKVCIFLLFELAGLCLTMLLSVVYTALFDGIAALRLALASQDLFLFIVPAWCAALFFGGNAARYLHADRMPRAASLLGMLAVLLAATLPMERIIAWNEAVRLPESLAALESWLRAQEDAAQALTQQILQFGSVGDMLAMLLIVGVLTGIGEEFVFRGIVQRLLLEKLRNSHAAVWIAAFLFSAIHFQFYGFVPRMLLGAFFGYLLVWSGNIWLPVAAHALNNSFAVLDAYFSENMAASEEIRNWATAGGVWIWLVSLPILTVLLGWLRNRCLHERRR